MKLKEDILKLRSEGKTYKEIKEILCCSLGVISYHCGKGQKEKHKKRLQKNRNSKVICQKIFWFYKKQLKDKTDGFQREKISEYAPHTKRGCKNLGKYLPKTFNYKDVLNKYGEVTQCYLTGRPIELLSPSTYQFDHIIPTSKGGTSTIDNLGLACRQANLAKSDMLVEEFIHLCKDVLEHNGYEVKKKSY
jgi:5-methylcytosine-specific restriction endonuclease McrA